MGSGVSRIPIPPLDGRTLPPRPLSICQFCWEGPFSVHLGILGVHKSHQPASPSTLRYIQGYSYSTSWTDLEARAATGCVWCQFLCRLPRGTSDTVPLDITLGSFPSRPGGSSATPSDYQSFFVRIGEETRFDGYIYAEPDNPAAPWIVARSHVRDVGSPHAMALAKACIDECGETHECCFLSLGSESEPLLPTRLIDCNDPDHPRLVPTADGRGEYLALSYVWGGAQPHQTTTSNISTYEHGIDPARLPATIRDAIRVTHALDFRFLWVDSLCIIQDSDEDRGRELRRMHHIYRDAYLTIIAASARGASEGFLEERPPAPRMIPSIPAGDITLPFICPSTLPGATHDPAGQHVGTVHISALNRVSNLVHKVRYSHSSEPISTRGWCMQEYLLSPRALVFTSDTLQYRCLTITHNVGNSYYSQTGERKLPPALFLSHPPLVEQSSKEWYDLHGAWLEVVEDYTQRAITVPSDKLVACGAIAATFQSILRSDYLAGLWRDRLLFDLLWHKEAGSDIPRPAAYRAPSWSWAAVDGAVKTDREWKIPAPGDGVAVAEVLRCDVSLADPALPHGSVIGGSLVLWAALVPCVLRLRTSGDSTVTDCVLLPPRHWTRIPHESGRARQRNGKKEAPEDAAGVGWAFIDCAVDAPGANIRQAWAVSLVRQEQIALSTHFSCREGLVVVQVDQADDPDMSSGEQVVFRRIGVFRLDESEHTRAEKRRTRRLAWLKRVPLIEIQLV